MYAQKASSPKFRDPPPIWASGKLRDWREDRRLTGAEVAERMDVSVSTYFRYEAGSYPVPMDMANKIVALTRGRVRYRDIYWNFHPEYA